MKAVPYGNMDLEIDYVGAQIDHFATQLSEADIVLVSCNFTQEAGACAEAIADIKRINPSVLVLVGGSDPTFRPAYYIDSDADIVVRGEAERLLPAILRRLLDSRDFSDLPNLAWRTQGGALAMSRMMHHEDRHLWLPSMSAVTYLVRNDVTVGWELHEGAPPPGVSERSIYFETSRGCVPGSCGFCTCPPKTGGPDGYRTAELEAMEDVLRSAAGHGVTTLQIIDDNFLARAQSEAGEAELYGLLDAFRRHGFAWEYGNGLQLSRLLSKGEPDHHLLAAMFSPSAGPDGRVIGGYRAFLPLETATRRRRPDGYGEWAKMEGVDLQTTVALIEAMDRAGVPMLSLGVMIGFPGDTHEDIDDTVKGMETVEQCLRGINRRRRRSGIPELLTHWDVAVYMLLPGTADFRRYRNRTLFHDDYYSHPELVNFHTAAYWPDHFSPWELTELRSQIADHFRGRELTNASDAHAGHEYVCVGV